ncbi:MAG: hypothetical protein KKI09_04305 [Spirochaetes bacterium]|nr:hypothetical protein [Spirochaetota bacterium]MBU0954632.1 hypothetical protein [Spirochaetota bacterium]
MKKVLTLVLVVCSLLAILPAQSIEDLFAVSEKIVCTVGDFKMLTPAFLEYFPDNADLPLRMQRQFERYDDDAILTKGRAARIIASTVQLKSSLFFILLPFERNAFRALLGDGLFFASSSSGDKISGVNLLDLIEAAGRKYGGLE